MDNVVSRRITVADMAPHVHTFYSGENKVNKLTKWLISWIELSLECGKIKPYDFLPSKGDLACHIGVSQGTMQNVFRLVEDAGYIESKQRIGTYIKDRRNDAAAKLTSKRELAIETVKKYLIENNYKPGETLISSRKLAAITGISNTTLRIAVSALAAEGILQKQENTFVISNLDFKVQEIHTQTLAQKAAENIREFVKVNIKPGEKLPSNSELKNLLNVSIKTIHDAIKILAKEGIVYTRRGQYGTIAAGEIHNQYFYEKVEEKIRHYIATTCKTGDKLPSIHNFANIFNTSEKTVKKALDNLAEDGYITFVRGRYGGTFVLDVPQTSKEAYTWLALNSDYITNIENC